ncbi:DNA-3-methyladenine glycosylase I [Methanobrevibacter arboriphilus]|uniref:DNA-3-methyladenine glycosylase I n=1 Tax=Methanobrevibacter arboriphilus TaxID=39441 RepID=UPI000A58F21E|nr:DNA-3-methyladenine glycosylase I [Methanobrevibacter arboriphilus]
MSENGDENSNKELIDNKRCGWVGLDPLYIKYHDEEWGKEVTDDHKIFEFVVLESAQAGLSWITILKRREGYKNAFKGFNPEKVAKMTEKDVECLLQDSGIIRHREDRSYNY